MGTIVGAGVGVGYGRTRLWRPTSEPGCPEWYKSTMGVTVTPDIARWLDLSGQFNHMPQDTAADKPSAGAGLLVFDKSNTEFLARSVIAGIDNGYTIGLALRYRTLPTGREVVCNNGTTANGLVIGSDNASQRSHWHGGVGTVTWGSITTNPETWVARHDGAGGSADFCLNGAHQTPQALGNNITPTTKFTLGAESASCSMSDLDIHAIIAYSDL